MHTLNTLFIFLPFKVYSELFVETATDFYHNQTGSIKEERIELIQQIGEHNSRIEKGSKLMLNDELK